LEQAVEPLVQVRLVRGPAFVQGKTDPLLAPRRTRRLFNPPGRTPRAEEAFAADSALLLDEALGGQAKQTSRFVLFRGRQAGDEGVHVERLFPAAHLRDAVTAVADDPRPREGAAGQQAGHEPRAL